MNNIFLHDEKCVNIEKYSFKAAVNFSAVNIFENFRDSFL